MGRKESSKQTKKQVQTLIRPFAQLTSPTHKIEDQNLHIQSHCVATHTPLNHHLMHVRSKNLTRVLMHVLLNFIKHLNGKKRY